MRSTKKQSVLGMVVVALMFCAPVLSIAGSLEPSAAPGPTMKTLDQIPPSWDQILPANDSTTSDGCNSSRFKCVMGGAGVLDKETGLVWERSPSTAEVNWATAMYTCQDKEVGNRKGWRLPTVEELSSLVDPIRSNPALPAGHPFTTLYYALYWSATTGVNDTTHAWYLASQFGIVTNYYDKTYSGIRVWCIRGGQGYNAY